MAGASAHLASKSSINLPCGGYANKHACGRPVGCSYSNRTEQNRTETLAITDQLQLKLTCVMKAAKQPMVSAGPASASAAQGRNLKYEYHACDATCKAQSMRDWLLKAGVYSHAQRK